MAEILLSNPEIKHGTIKIGFTPDEEIAAVLIASMLRAGADLPIQSMAELSAK